jgi:glycosyltransferase involved in cell wall biosynthesis
MAIEHSLIVTTYNRPDTLKLVLDSILHQSVFPKEVIIADDGSKIETKNLITSYQDRLPNLIHVWHEDLGFRLAAIRNKAINQCYGEFISLIDGDMILHPSFIKDIQSHIEPNYYLQGKRVLLSEDLTNQILKQESIGINYFSHGITNRFNTLSIPWLSQIISRKHNSIKSVKGCSMHFWKEDAERVNGFNEAFIGWGREDSEFLQRLLNVGVQRKNIALGAVAYHLFHPEAPRTQLDQNDTILDDTIRLKKVWCTQGLSKI